MIDGYCHCGLSKYSPAEDVAEMMCATGIESAVLVQHHGEFDNTYLASVVTENDSQFCAVAMFDPTDCAWPRLLAEAAEDGRLKGIRLPRETLLGQPDFCAAAADREFVLMVDAQRGIRELMTAVETLLAQGTHGVVISHLGYPRIDDGELVAGRELLSLARFPQVHVLLSGTAMWPEEAQRALDEFTLEILHAFGTSRVLWGSNYPPCGGVPGVREDVERIMSDRWGFTPEELDAVTHRNAQRLWFTHRRA